MHWGDYGTGMGLGWLFMIIFWGFVVLGVVYLVTLIAKGGEKKSHEDSALEVLKKRYARGELSREEFEKMKDDLRKD
jgi:putative membrane protein